MQLTGFGDRDILIPPYGTNGLPYPNPDLPLTAFRGTTIHGTGNTTAGANALATVKWVLNYRPPASFTFCADDREVIQLMRVDRRTWDKGDGCDSPTKPSAYYISIEICENSDCDYRQACWNAAGALAKVHHAYGVPPVDGQSVFWPNSLHEHKYWAYPHGPFPAFTTHSSCPAGITAGRSGMSWAKMVQFIQQRYTALSNQRMIGPVGQQFPIKDGFRAFYEQVEKALGAEMVLRIFGNPLSAEQVVRDAQGHTKTIMRFERLDLEWTAGVAPPWDVVVAFRDQTYTPLPALAAHQATAADALHVFQIQPDEQAIIASIDAAHKGHGR